MKTLYVALSLVLSGSFAKAAEYQACPKWQVTVVDEKGQPLSACDVEQTWAYYYGTGSIESSTNVVTNSKGQVELPERKVSISSGVVTTGKLVGLLNVHSSSGPSSTVYVSKKGYDRVSVWRNPKLTLTNGVFYSTVTLRREQRPAAITEAVLAGDLVKLTTELQKDAYYAKDMHGVALVNEVIRSAKVEGQAGVEMVDLVLSYLGKPDPKKANKTYGPGYGIQPYVEFEDKDHLTALQRAIALKKFEIAQHLLSIGVMPNPEAPWQTPRSPSALHLAVQSGNLELVKALLANKAKVDAKDPDGQTPLDLAKKSSGLQIIQLLEPGK